MIAVVQRVLQSSVTIDGAVHSKIDGGLLVLLGVEDADTLEDVEWLVRKIVNLRIFSDGDGKMNESLGDVKGQMLVVSQFTLHASIKKGNRPSYIKSAHPDHAIPMYEAFIHQVRESSICVETGVFGADMKVALVNEGPVTIIIDTKNKL